MLTNTIRNILARIKELDAQIDGWSQKDQTMHGTHKYQGQMDNLRMIQRTLIEVIDVAEIPTEDRPAFLVLVKEWWERGIRVNLVGILRTERKVSTFSGGCLEVHHQEISFFFAD